MSNHHEQVNRAQRFVAFVIERIKKDKGIAAVFRRADNPATEYQCWEQLAAFNIELEKPYERVPFAAIAAAIAKTKAEQNGAIGIGRMLASCYEEGCESNQAKTKLRRLLACDSVEEVCRILRPLFSLIESRSDKCLDFANLLNELLRFHSNSQQIKSRWAQDFYRRTTNAEVNT